MIETSKYHTLGAFVLGVTVASVWAAYRARQNELQGGFPRPASAQHNVEQDDTQSLHSSRVDAASAGKESKELELSVVKSVANIKEGIEGTIGNTPLIKIRSLSDATGCEILAKAEVIMLLPMHMCSQ
jgi:cysteine synthase A